MPPRARAGTLLIAAVVLAACAGAPRVSSTLRNDNAWSFAKGVMREGPLLVELGGTPFAGDGDRLGEVITAEMARAITFNADSRFTTDPDEAGSRSLRIVMSFNAGTPGSADQCQGRTQAGGPASDGTVAIAATLCSGEEAESNVRGRVGGVDGLDDPRFRMLVRQITLEMFVVRRDRDRNRGGIGIGVGVGL